MGEALLVVVRIVYREVHVSVCACAWTRVCTCFSAKLHPKLLYHHLAKLLLDLVHFLVGEYLVHRPINNPVAVRVPPRRWVLKLVDSGDL